jgi:hypothetical protein
MKRPLADLNSFDGMQRCHPMHNREIVCLQIIEKAAAKAAPQLFTINY